MNNDIGIDKRLIILANAGWNILKIKDGDNDLYFDAEEFEPPQINSSISIPFLTFKGIEISAFLTNNVYSQSDPENFIINFQSYLDKEIRLLYKFSDSYKWISYNSK